MLNVIARLGAWVFVCLGLTSVFAYTTETEIVQKKLEATRQLPSLEANRHLHGPYSSRRVRPQTERDSGFEEALLFVQNTNFRFVDKIGFYVRSLSVKLLPVDPASPVVFDDPLGFVIEPVEGVVALSSESLTALMNKHVFDFPGAPLRNLTVTPAKGTLKIKGQMNRRGRWVYFAMNGKLTLSGDHVLLYRPFDVIVDGQNATQLLKSANVNLDELLTVKAVGVELVRSTIYLDASQLFPPPKLKLDIDSIGLEDDALILRFASDAAPVFPEPLENRESRMIVRGGDVKFLRAMPLNAQVQIMSDNHNAGLDFCLYDYRKQIVPGYLRLKEDGSILAYLRNYNELPGVE